MAVTDGGDVDSGGTDGGGNPVDGGGNDGGGTDGGGTDAGTTDGGQADGGPPGDCMALVPPVLDLEVRAMGLTRPTAMAQPPGETSDIYVAEQNGRVQIVNAAGAREEFLNLRTIIGNTFPNITDPADGDERGLLGLAFHPDYATNGRFFVAYTSGGRDVVREFRRSSANPRRAELPPGDPVLIRDNNSEQGNHNGGNIAFGPDGFLYASTGDGGVQCDTDGDAQDLSSPLGKIHRYDVNATPCGGACTPDSWAAAGNPFTAVSQRTVWAYGFRNPWRFSFDRMTGDLWIADVGQNFREEIDFQPRSSTGGENYGWLDLEGFCSSDNNSSNCNSSFDRNSCPTPAEHTAMGFTPPVFDYSHGAGGSPAIRGNVVAGGFVYRGSVISELQGWYLFGDSGSGQRAAIRLCPGGAVNARPLDSLNGRALGLSSFGEDNAGELYMLSLVDGTVYHIIAN